VRTARGLGPGSQGRRGGRRLRRQMALFLTTRSAFAAPPRGRPCRPCRNAQAATGYRRRYADRSWSSCPRVRRVRTPL